MPVPYKLDASSILTHPIHLKTKVAAFVSGIPTGIFKDSTAVCCNEKIQTGKDQQQSCSKIEMRAQMAL